MGQAVVNLEVLRLPVEALQVELAIKDQVRALLEAGKGQKLWRWTTPAASLAPFERSAHGAKTEKRLFLSRGNSEYSI
jgi:hypothetical protein